MRKIKFLYAILLISISIVFAETIFSEVSVQPDGDKVTISWVTLNEQNISAFSIRRSHSDDDNSFVEIASVKPKGPGSRYEYIDQDVYGKTTGTMFYKIVGVDQNGNSVSATNSMFVKPNISGVYKTWGAIKAIFR